MDAAKSGRWTAATGTKPNLSRISTESGLVPADDPAGVPLRGGGVKMGSDGYSPGSQMPLFLNRARFTAAACPPQPTAPKPYDPNGDSDALYKSMHGGLFGIGKDKDAIYASLRGKSQAEVTRLEATYKDHYGHDLQADLSDKLSGKDLDRAQALLQGNQSRADALGIEGAIGTLWNDNQGIHQLLAGRTSEERAALAGEYQKATGHELRADLDHEMSGTDRDKALALLDGDKAKAAAADIQNSRGWFSNDGKAVAQSLEGKTSQEREAIASAYKQKYGVELKDYISQDLSGTDRDQAEAALKGDQAALEAAHLKDAQGLLWSDKKAIFASLQGKTPQERQKIAAACQKNYGVDLAADLQNDLSGSQLEHAQALLQKGTLSEAEQLKFALADSDKEAIKATLGGRSKEEVARIRADYQSLTGHSLDDAIQDGLSGRDRFDAQQALKGRPASLDEAVERAHQAHAFEREGLGNAVGSAFVDVFSEKGETIDRDLARMDASQQRRAQLLAQGRVVEARAEEAQLAQLVGYGQGDVGNYRDAKDSAATTAGTVAATAAGVAVVIASGGTAAPVLATAFLAASAGAGAKVVASGLVHGQEYTGANALSDAATGAIDGGTSVIGMGGGAAVAKTVAVAGEAAEVSAAEMLVNGGKIAAEGALSKAQQRLLINTAGDALAADRTLLTKALLARTVQGARDGMVGGAVGSGAGQAVDGENWQVGLGRGLLGVAGATLVGAGTGAVTGGALSGGYGLTGWGQRGLRRELSGELQNFANRQHFRVLDEGQQAGFRQLAGNHSNGAAFLPEGPSRNVDARLLKLLQNGTVDSLDANGSSVIDHLLVLDRQKLARGLNNGQLFSEATETLANPGIIHQDAKGTCAATVVEYMHARQSPADYLRVTNGLTSEAGEVRLLNGDLIARNPTGLAIDGTGRSNLDRIYQSTVMDYGAGGHYDNLVDCQIESSGFRGHSGLSDAQTVSALEGVFGGGWEIHRNSWSEKTEELFTRHVEELAAKKQQVPVGMNFDGGHKLSVTGIDSDYVYLRNPWGQSEDGLGGPARELVDEEGSSRMKREDFFSHLISWETPSYATPEERFVGSLRKTRADLLGEDWRRHANMLGYPFSDATLEIMRAKRLAEVDGLIGRVDAGEDLRSLAHENGRDLLGRSDQYVNRNGLEGGASHRLNPDVIRLAPVADPPLASALNIDKLLKIWSDKGPEGAPMLAKLTDVKRLLDLRRYNQAYEAMQHLGNL